MAAIAETFPTVQVYYSSAWLTLPWQTAPKLHIAENQGADVSFGVQLTSYYATRCVPGTRLRVYVGSTLDLYFDGFITSAAKGTDNELTVKAVDLLTLFGSMGASLYRDFYNYTLGTAYAEGTYDSDNTSINAVFASSNYRVTGIGDIIFNANDRFSTSDSDPDVAFQSGDTWVFNYQSHGLTYFRALTCTVFSVGSYEYIAKGNATVKCDGVVLATTSWEAMDNTQSYTFKLDAGAGYYFVKDKALEIQVNLGDSSVSGVLMTNVWVADSDDSRDTFYYHDSSGNGITVSKKVLSATWYGYIEKAAESGYQSGATVYLTGIEDVTIESAAVDTTFDGALSAAAFTRRMIIPYFTGTISAVQVMQQIVEASGYSSSVGTSSLGAALTEFRAAGGNFLDYLQTLADANEDGGRYFSLGASGSTIYIGARQTKADAASYAIVYGADSGGSYANKMGIVSAEPNISLVNRHPICIAKGTKTTNGSSSTSTPLIVACVDTSALDAIDKNLTDLASDSSLSTGYACASAALSKVMSNRANEWSGTFTVSGIWRDLVSRASGSYGSGIPVRIFYSPLGLSDYAAKVKEITIDWEAATTAVVVNNYSVLYSNSITDSSAMALHASNYMADSSTDTSFTTQYVLVYASATQSLLSSGNTITVKLLNGLTATADAEVYKFPDLGTATVSAVFASGSSSGYDNTNAHSVSEVKINSNSYITIDSAIRPDKRFSQTLIINIIVAI